MEPALALEPPAARYPPEMISRVGAFSLASTLADRNAALIELIGWTRKAKHSGGEGDQILQLIEYLEQDASMRQSFQASFGELLRELRCLSLFAEAGIPSDHSLTSEIAQRLAGRLVPSAREESDASRLLVTLYFSKREVRRFLAMPEERFERLTAILTPAEQPSFWQHQAADLREALRLLAARIGGLGLKPEMRDRSSSSQISDSPFYEIVASTEDLIAAADTTDTKEVKARWQQVVSRCRWEILQVHNHMETAGVSVELIFDLRKIRGCLARMEAMVAVLVATGQAGEVSAIRALAGQLMQGRLEDRSLRSLLHQNLNLIARKMVERTGHSGEHYIAYNRAEYWLMWRAAAGGGLLTVFTAAIKMRIVDAHLPLFVEGFLSGTNYAVSFVLLQVFGLVLATKQPAATAATFAGIIRDNKGRERSSKLADFVAHITSTQLAAAIGNVAAVSLGAIAFNKLWNLWFSESYLANESATHVYETLHPFASGTALYAIITGVILWLAALAGGWFENFAVYYRFTDAVAQHPLRLKFGESRMSRIAEVLQRNLGGWSTSIILGYLLGFTPVLGKFFGLPLDIRHVTLSTGTLALAASRYGTESLGRAWFYYAVEGIAVIFVLNLFVSFTIAAYVGLRAYDVGPAEQWQILRFLVAEGIKSPLRFILPSKDSSSAVREH